MVPNLPFAPSFTSFFAPTSVSRKASTLSVISGEFTTLSIPFLVRMAREIEEVRLFKIECPGAAAKLRALIAESTIRVVATGHVHQARRVAIDDRVHVWAPSTWALPISSRQPARCTRSRCRNPS